MKPATDNKEYRAVELSNGLKVMLVSDPTTETAAAAMNIHCGSFQDPLELPGLAHFHEHMVFLGTKKVWGEDMVLFSPELRTQSCARALNYLEVHMIGRDELLGIAVLYPRTYRLLRRQIAFFALRRFIITMAKESLGLPRSALLHERTRTRACTGR